MANSNLQQKSKKSQKQKGDETSTQRARKDFEKDDLDAKPKRDRDLGWKADRFGVFLEGGGGIGFGNLGLVVAKEGYHFEKKGCLARYFPNRHDRHNWCTAGDCDSHDLPSSMPEDGCRLITSNSDKVDRQYAEDSMGTWKSVSAGGHQAPSSLMSNIRGSRAAENPDGRKDAEGKDGDNKARGKGKSRRSRRGGRGKVENKRQ